MTARFGSSAAHACIACVLAWHAFAPRSARADRPTAAAEPVAATEAVPSEAVQAEYRDVTGRAIAEFEAGRFAEARALFMRGHELWPSARTYRVLGMTSFELRNYVSAMQELEAALADPRRPLEEQPRAEVAALLERTKAFVGRYHVRVAPTDAQLFIDGSPGVFGSDGSLLLEVGTHELLARAQGRAVLRRQLFVEGNTARDLTLELAPLASDAQMQAPPPTASASAPSAAPESTAAPLWPWFLGGAIVTGVTAGVMFAVTDSKADKCRPDCSDDDVSSIHTGDAITITASVLSVGLLITSAVLLLRPSEAAAHSATPARHTLTLGPGSVGLRGSF